MPISVLCLICCVIAFFGLGLHKKRKPDVEGVNRAIETQRKRLEELRRAELMRVHGSDLRTLKYVYASRIDYIEWRLANAIKKISAEKVWLSLTRRRLESVTKVLEYAISDSERGIDAGYCRPEVIDSLKVAYEKELTPFDWQQFWVHCRVSEARSELDSLQNKVTELREWMSERAELVQAAARQLIERSESTICSRKADLESLLEGVDTDPAGIEEEKVTPGVIKWREEQNEARQKSRRSQ